MSDSTRPSDAQGQDQTLARLAEGRANLPDGAPSWVGDLLNEAVAKIQALQANERVADLDALACSLFDGEPVSAEEALRELHGEVMRLLGAEVAKVAPSPATIRRVELDHVGVGADGRVGIGGAIRLPDGDFDGFEGMDWMDDVRAWRGALLSLVGGRTGELLEHWGEDYHREALLAGDGDSAWYDNLPAPLQARWIALVRERRAMERVREGGGYGPDHDGTTASAAERLTREIQGCLDVIPGSYRVRVHPRGGGPENLPKSLAVSVARMAHDLEELQRTRDGLPPISPPVPDMSFLQGSLGIPFPLPEHPRAGGTRAVGASAPQDGPGTLELNTDPPDWSTAGRRARWARVEAGLSMGQAARLFELSTSTISAYEVGDFGCAALADADTRGPIPDDLLVRMADAYGVRLSFLRTGAVPERPDEETRNMLERLAIRSPADADRIARLLSVHGKDPE